MSGIVDEEYIDIYLSGTEAPEYICGTEYRQAYLYGAKSWEYIHTGLELSLKEFLRYILIWDYD